MKYRPLGKTELQVSEIGFGCGNTGGILTGGTPEEQRRTVQRAIELGINFFDTAPNYGERTGGTGTSEANLGRVLYEIGARPIICTKVEFWPSELDDIPGKVARSVDASLERLGVDAIDLLYLHNRVAGQRVLRNSAMGSHLTAEDVLGPSGALPALERAQQEGKARFLGFCSGGGDVGPTRQVLESGGFDVVQLTYNLLNPTEGWAPPPGFESDDYGQHIDHAAARHMGVVVIRVLAGGALAASERHPLNTGSRVEEQYEVDRTRAESLRFLADEGDQTMAQAAIRFALAKPEISSVLVGFSDLSQIEEAVAASAMGPLPAATLGRIEGLYTPSS